MKRRDFLTATAALGTASVPALAEGPRLQWRLAASVSRTNDVIWEGLELIRRHVALATGLQVLFRGGPAKTRAAPGSGDNRPDCTAHRPTPPLNGAGALGAALDSTTR